jgi:hypothetical protein
MPVVQALSIRITEKGVTGVAPSSWDAFQERVARLYEQNAPLEEIRRGVELLYVRRWNRWVNSGVRDLVVSFSFRSTGVFLDPLAAALAGPEFEESQTAKPRCQ